MLFISLWYFCLGLQLDKFGHDKGVLFILGKLILNNHVDFVKVCKSDLACLLILRVDKELQIIKGLQQ